MKKSNGFTIVELMTVILITATLLVLAVPSFQQSMRNNRLTTQANELFTALSLARMSAIERGVSVTVCASADQTSCSGSTNWQTGWIVFTDINADHTRDGTDCATESDDCVLRVWGALNGSSVLTGGNSYITFSPDGRASSVTNITLKSAASCGTNEKRIISVSATGRIMVVKGDCP